MLEKNAVERNNRAVFPGQIAQKVVKICRANGRSDQRCRQIVGVTDGWARDAQLLHQIGTLVSVPTDRLTAR
jgi:hypothetical protein